MHTYAPLWRDGELDDELSIAGFRFNDALDVVAWAERDRLVGWKTWPDVWHLDEEGAFCCYQKASSLDSIRAWALDPTGLYRSRWEAERKGVSCPDRWVIVESRVVGLWDEPIVAESDAASFLAVRKHLATRGIVLADAMIFDDKHHWWSMHELTSGTTRW